LLYNFPTVRRAVLDFTFTSDIVNFAGFDGSNPLIPTVEFFIKVTLGGVQYKEVALEYTITLNGEIETSDAFLVDAEVAADVETSVSYTATAYVCDIEGTALTIDVAVTEGNTIYVCLESDSTEAPVTGIQDLSLSTADTTQVLYRTNSVQRLARSVNDCAGGKCIVEVFPGVDFFKHFRMLLQRHLLPLQEKLYCGSVLSETPATSSLARLVPIVLSRRSRLERSVAALMPLPVMRSPALPPMVSLPSP
jgi:hypothetical protein